MHIERTRVLTPLGPDLVIASDGREIVESRFERRKRTAGTQSVADPLLREARAQVRAYFARRLTRFDLPLCLSGTPFAREVYALVASLETGELISYGDVGRALGYPHAHRAVASAMSRSPLDLFVPAHRVIGADGTVRGAGPNSIRRKLLAHEGIRLR